MDNDTLLSVESLSFGYTPERLILKDISMKFRRGSVVALMGGSGSGKTTVLRLIAAQLQPLSGKVLVNGIDVHSLGKREIYKARRHLGMLFQFGALFTDLDIFDNVAFPLRIHGVHDRERIRQRVHECIEVVGLADRLDHYPAQLSGGQKQRVAIARALAPSPSVLLCDEPTSALDAETTRSVLATLKEINRRLGVTIVIVTHELSVVRALCRQVAVVEQGLLVETLDLEGREPLAPVSSLGRELAQMVAAAVDHVAWRRAAGIELEGHHGV